VPFLVNVYVLAFAEPWNVSCHAKYKNRENYILRGHSTSSGNGGTNGSVVVVVVVVVLVVVVVVT